MQVRQHVRYGEFLPIDFDEVRMLAFPFVSNGNTILIVLFELKGGARSTLTKKASKHSIDLKKRAEELSA